MAKLKEGSTVGGKRILVESPGGLGNVKAGQGFYIKDDFLYVKTTVVSSTSTKYTKSGFSADNTTPEKRLELGLAMEGTIRTSFGLKTNGDIVAYVQIYINNEPIGTLRETNKTSIVTMTEEFEVSYGDVLSVYAWVSPYEYYRYASVSDFTIGYDFTTKGDIIEI